MKLKLIFSVVTLFLMNGYFLAYGEEVASAPAVTAPAMTAPTEENGQPIVENEKSDLVEVGNKICPVSGNSVHDESMGEPVKLEYQGKAYTLCCTMCIKDFNKDPEKYSKKALEEVAAQEKTEK